MRRKAKKMMRENRERIEDRRRKEGKFTKNSLRDENRAENKKRR